MNTEFAILKRAIDNVSGGSGGNPSGGSVDIATVNYNATLLQQWISLTLGSSSAVSMNLPNSVIESMNLYASTLFYLGAVNKVNAVYDILFSRVAGTTTYLPGFINPAALKLSLHVQGTNDAVIPTTNTADKPVYNSNTTTGKLMQTAKTLSTPSSMFVDGTIEASSTLTGYDVANVLDANTGTFWYPNTNSVIPTLSGIATADSGTAANAFDNSSTTEWISDNSQKVLPASGTASASAGTAANAFDGVFNNKWEVLSGTTGWLKYDLGSGNAVALVAYQIQAAQAGTYGGGDRYPKDWTFDGSNNNTDWTTLDTRTGITGANGWSSALTTRSFSFVNTTAYRYYRLNVTANNGGVYMEIGELRGYIFTNKWLKYDLGSGNTITPSNYTLHSITALPISWILQGSNNDTDWDNLETVDDYASAFPYNATISTIVAYRYFRIYITKGAITSSISQFKVNPKFIENNPQEIKYDVGSGVSRLVQQYTVNATTYLPVDWTFDGSNNGTDWTTLDTVTAYASSFPVTRTFINTALYRYFRMRTSKASGNGDYLAINTLTASATPVDLTYDTSKKVIGTNSVRSLYYFMNGTAADINHLKLANNDWVFRGFFNFRSGFAFPQTLFTIKGKALEVQATATGLRVNYSTDGSNFVTLNSDSHSFSYDTWYWISVGRTGNNITYHVSEAGSTVNSWGTSDITGVTIFATATNAWNVGADSSNLVPFFGNFQEIEFFSGENPNAILPTDLRTTAYIPAVSWLSRKSYIPTGITTVGCDFLLDEVTYASFGVPVIGTDLTLDISLDNGVTFINLPITKTGTLTSNTVLGTGEVDVSSLTNTNEFIYRINSVSGKVCKFDGAIFFWN